MQSRIILILCLLQIEIYTEFVDKTSPYMFPTDRQPIFLKSQYDIREKVLVMG